MIDFWEIQKNGVLIWYTSSLIYLINVGPVTVSLNVTLANPVLKLYRNYFTIKPMLTKSHTALMARRIRSSIVTSKQQTLKSFLIQVVCPLRLINNGIHKVNHLYQMNAKWKTSIICLYSWPVSGKLIQIQKFKYIYWNSFEAVFYKEKKVNMVHILNGAVMR